MSRDKSTRYHRFVNTSDKLHQKVKTKKDSQKASMLKSSAEQLTTSTSTVDRNPPSDIIAIFFNNMNF